MNEKTVGMLIGKKNVYEYLELSNAVTCMNYVNKETEIPPVLMMHGLADDKAWRFGILDREEYGYCGKIFESPHGLRRYRLYYLLYSIPFQIFNAMYPVFISIGAGFGIPTVTNAIVILLAVIFGII